MVPLREHFQSQPKINRKNQELIYCKNLSTVATQTSCELVWQSLPNNIQIALKRRILISILKSYVLACPAGNGEFCFPSSSMRVPSASHREQWRSRGNKTHRFPLGQSLSAYNFTSFKFLYFLKQDKRTNSVTCDTQCDFGRPAPLIILRKTSFNGRWSAGVDPSPASLTIYQLTTRQALMIQKFRPLCFRRLWSTVAGCNLISAGVERWFCVYSRVEKPTMPIQALGN